MSDRSSEGDYLVKFPVSRNTKWLEKEPVVLLFGWAGCKNRYLDKYVQLYQMQGCTTYQFTAPNDVIFWRHDQLRGLVDNMASDFFEFGHGDHPILFHVFSNGGCYVLHQFLQYFRDRHQRLNPAMSIPPGYFANVDLRGLVFDSSPARGDGWTRAQAFTEAQGYAQRRPWLKRLITGALGMLFTVCNWYRAAAAWIRGLPSPSSTHPFHALLKLDLRCPMLFLYSKADTITKYHYIEAFMEKQRQRGVQVTQVRFDDSPHCQHGRVHPNEYNQAVKTFLYDSMGASTPTKTRSKSGDGDNGEDFVQLNSGDTNGNGSNYGETDDFELAD